MKEPIKVGDMAEVVWGKLGVKSPNLGKIVKVVEMREENSALGPKWRCEAPELWFYNEFGKLVSAPFAVFPTLWLKKIHPPEISSDTPTEKEKELSQ